MDCPYEVVIKQSIHRKRHLVCATIGHKSFRFNSYSGCPQCEQENESYRNAALIELVTHRDEIAQGATGVDDTAGGVEETDEVQIKHGADRDETDLLWF